MANKEPIQTSDAPAAIGPYSQAIKSGAFVFLSGQIPLDPEFMELVGSGGGTISLGDNLTMTGDLKISAASEVDFMIDAISSVSYTHLTLPTILLV